jgi:hypothetical protein
MNQLCNGICGYLFHHNVKTSRDTLCFFPLFRSVCACNRSFALIYPTREACV